MVSGDKPVLRKCGVGARAGGVANRVWERGNLSAESPGNITYFIGSSFLRFLFSSDPVKQKTASLDPETRQAVTVVCRRAES